MRIGGDQIAQNCPCRLALVAFPRPVYNFGLFGVLPLLGFSRGFAHLARCHSYPLIPR
jgi:hypothetical protein